MKKDIFCLSSSPCLSRETARIFLLGALIALYMVAGAAIFSVLERPEELKAHHLWEKKLKEFSHKHRVDLEDLTTLLRQYEKAYSSGIRADSRREQWDFPGAFYFVGTVVSTIGFGMTAPATPVGKVILVLYGLLGCSATLLFFNLFLERVITMLGLLTCWCHRRRTRNASGLHRGGHTHQQRPESTGVRSGKECVTKKEWKPSVYSVALILFAAALVVACGAATLYSTMEGWSYFESLYFCFVAFSTLGFGDLVSGQRERHQDTLGYQVANCLLMLLGVCCTYSLFNAVSVVVKQALNWILSTMGYLQRTACACWPHARPLHTVDCFVCSSVCLCWEYREEALSRHQMQTVNQWDNSVSLLGIQGGGSFQAPDANSEPMG